MKLTYIKQTGEPVGDGGDQYTGLDRFGRVVDQRWPQGEAELERVDYGFSMVRRLRPVSVDDKRRFQFRNALSATV